MEPPWIRMSFIIKSSGGGTIEKFWIIFSLTLIFVAVITMNMIIFIIPVSINYGWPKPFEESAIEIFDIPCRESYLYSFSYENDEVSIHYNFNPRREYNYRHELGFELIPKIKKYFEMEPTLQNIKFTIRHPFQADEGNIDWIPILSFEFSREILNHINWEDFLEPELLRVAQNVKIYRKNIVEN